MSFMSDFNYDVEKWTKFCEDHDPREAGEKLHAWVNADQPDGFLDHFKWRMMSSLTADCYKSRYGGNWDYIDFYHAMCGDEIHIGDSSAYLRKKRHIRCGIPLDPVKDEKDE